MLFIKQITHSELETSLLAKEFAKNLNPGDIIALIGELGCGKTIFVRGIAEFFKVEEFVTSPTFTIMNQYIGNYRGKKLPIFHIDLYRIKKQEELSEIGLNECLDDLNSIKLIEWPEKIIHQIPKSFYKVVFENGESEDDRIITISLIEN